MVGAPTSKNATYADLEALPENVVGEIIDGELHVWFVDPALELVEALQVDREPYLILGTGGAAEKVRLPPFEALELDLALLWAR